MSDNGDTYKGMFKKGKREGQGVMIFENNDMYDGNWKEDQFHGFGTFSSFDQHVKYSGN